LPPQDRHHLQRGRIVGPQASPAAGQVRDVNSYSLGALVEQAGGEPVLYGIISDQRQALQQALQTAQDDARRSSSLPAHPPVHVI